MHLRAIVLRRAGSCLGVVDADGENAPETQKKIRLATAATCKGKATDNAGRRCGVVLWGPQPQLSSSQQRRELGPEAGAPCYSARLLSDPALQEQNWGALRCVICVFGTHLRLSGTTYIRFEVDFKATRAS